MRNFESFTQNQAWLTIFLPALLYYTLLSPTTTSLLSYLNLQPSYAPLNTTISIANIKAQERIHQIFYHGNDHRRRRSNLDIVILDKNASFYDLTWVEDAELGRGYLLVSDSSSNGKVWRYETGGGLIPIGKSLYLDQSGCRSNIWTPCHDTTCTVDAGSKGMAIQFVRDEKRFDMGSLIIVENGEKRIVRLEQDGARTPLVLNVPSLCEDGGGTGSRRLNNPGKIMYTPFGDLLFVDEEYCKVPLEHDENEDENENEHGIESIMTLKSAIYRIKEVVNIPPITFQQSRHAHAWTVQDMTSKHVNVNVELLYVGAQHVSDMIWDKDVSFMYVAASIRNNAQECRFVIYKIKDEDDEDDDNEKEESHQDVATKNFMELDIFYDLTPFFPSTNIPQCNMYGSALTIDHQGHVYATYPGGLVLLDQDGELMASIQIVDNGMMMESSESSIMEPTALTIGNDGYLYMSTKTMVQRLKIKTKVLEQPTNLVVPKLQ